MSYQTLVSTTGEFFDTSTLTVITCCSEWHDNDCYHCSGKGFCGCSILAQEYQDQETAKFYSDVMRCWCGACEDENGAVIHPAPCAQYHWNKMSELSER